MADIREMTNKFFTSVEQGRKLVELGIDSNSADLHWSIYGHTGGKVIDGEYCLCFGAGCWDEDENGYRDIPCWSLSDLLKLFPVIKKDKQGILVVKPWVTTVVDGEAWCQYGDMSRSGTDPIDAAFNMLFEVLKK